MRDFPHIMKGIVMNVAVEHYPHTIRVAKQLIAGARDSGITLDRWTEEVYDGKVGYVVGGRTPGLKLPVNENKQYIVNMVARWLQALPTNFGLIGGWIDGDYLYLDSVSVIDDLPEALALGLLRKQIAIYDLANQRDITI